AAGSGGGPALRHVGVYAFRRAFLLEFATWPPSPLERAERLEQLRALERGVKIRVVTGTRPFSGVDTPEQMAALEARGRRGQGRGPGRGGPGGGGGARPGRAGRPGLCAMQPYLPTTTSFWGLGKRRATIR